MWVDWFFLKKFYVFISSFLIFISHFSNFFFFSFFELVFMILLFANVVKHLVLCFWADLHFFCLEVLELGSMGTDSKPQQRHVINLQPNSDNNGFYMQKFRLYETRSVYALTILFIWCHFWSVYLEMEFIVLLKMFCTSLRIWWSLDNTLKCKFSFFWYMEELELRIIFALCLSIWSLVEISFSPI